MKVRETVTAVADLARILDYLDQHSTTGGGKLARAYEAARVQMAHFPYAATKIEGMDVWRLPLVRLHYTIFYRVVSTDDEVQVLRVVHGARVRRLDELPD